MQYFKLTPEQIERTKRRMLETMPTYYRDSPQANATLGGQALQIARRQAEADDLLEQMLVTNATWSLDKYEEIYGITPAISSTDEERRLVILAKMRGAMPTTLSQIKRVAEMAYGGTVEIVTDYAHYTIYIKTRDNFGEPSNLAAISAAIQEIIPAHIAYLFRFRYLTVGEVDIMTVSELSKQPLHKFTAGEEYDGN